MRTCAAVACRLRDHQTAASPVACAAAAEVPAKGRGRQKLANGTGAARSGLGRLEFGPQELYDSRACIRDGAHGNDFRTVGRKGNASLGSRISQAAAECDQVEMASRSLRLPNANRVA